MNKSKWNYNQNRSCSQETKIMQKQGSLQKKKDIFTSHHKINQPSKSKDYFQQAKKSEFFQTENLKNSCKVWTTDESNPCHSSNDQNSINIAPIRSRRNIYTEHSTEYQEIKQTKSPIYLKKIANKGPKNISSYFSSKMAEIEGLELRHQRELIQAKSSMEKHELTRLIKIHSMQKLYTLSRLKQQVKNDFKRR